MSALRAVRSAPESLWRPTPYRLRVGTEGVLIFDSTFSGGELPNDPSWHEDLPRDVTWLGVALPAGVYRVETADCEPDEATHLILHRLRRASQEPSERNL